MRLLIFTAVFLLAGIVAASAQVQERKLIDRLLEPNMSLQNSAQNRQFALRGSDPKTKQARTKAFHIRERTPEKKWNGQRNFLTRIFGTRRARENKAQAYLSRKTIATPQLPTATSVYVQSKPRLAQNQTYPVSQFTGSRPFLAQGKSQKALNQRPPPLTIDQVRELLNKNK